MRNIPPAALAQLQGMQKIEPIIIVKVFWNGVATSYCDRKFETEGLQGKLLTITGIEDVIDVSSNANSVSMSITLDDSDGSIKTIYDNNDIHKTYVQVFQWISQLPIAESFLIYEGEISSPIEWSEGPRNLKFDVLSRLEDREVGFSAEEGKFAFLPASLVGKAWPIVFGTVGGIPLLEITESPSAILSSGFGIVGEEAWTEELDALYANLNDLVAQSTQANALSNQATSDSTKYQSSEFGLGDDPDKVEQYRESARSYFEQAMQYTADFTRLSLELEQKLQERDFQRTLEASNVPITASNLPANYPLSIQIGNFSGTATILGNRMQMGTLTELVDPNIPIGSNTFDFQTGLVNQFARQQKTQKFTWFDGGTTVKIFNFPRHYIASIGTVTVLNLWAPNKYSRRAVIPREWYTVTVEAFGSMTVTKVIFSTPLTSRPGEWDDGTIVMDCTSSQSNNIVDIMQWAIENYSDLPYDSASFSYARAKVDAFRANFALVSRKNLIQFLQELAFQARCQIWVNDRKFFVRFMPEQLAATTTVTEADIEINSMVVSSTETERLVTKFTAEWRASLDQTEPNKIIFRNNILKYGTFEETYDFYAYNYPEAVAKVAEFWMIRKSNTWKRISLKLLLNKLEVEAFDLVNFDFAENFVANGPIVGVVEKAFFDADDDTIAINAWLPVRLGEMAQYVFAYPFDVTTVYPVLTDPNIITGNPFDDATGQIAPPEVLLTTAPYLTISSNGNSYTQGRGLPIDDASFDPPNEFITALDPNEVNQNRPVGLAASNNTSRYQVKPLTTNTVTEPPPNTFYGTVVAQSGSTAYEYTCLVYFKGLSNPGTLQQVLIGQIREGSVLPEGYPLEVHRTIYTDGVGSQRQTFFEYWAQPPIWVNLDEE